jgi:hypothetical protein
MQVKGRHRIEILCHLFIYLEHKEYKRSKVIYRFRYIPNYKIKKVEKNLILSTVSLMLEIKAINQILFIYMCQHSYDYRMYDLRQMNAILKRKDLKEK